MLFLDFVCLFVCRMLMGGLWLVLIWYLKLKVLFFLFRRALAGAQCPCSVRYTYLVYLYCVTGDGLSFWMGGRLFPA